MLIEQKTIALGDEPASGEPDTCVIVFRKPTGSGRIQRLFYKTDLVQKLYDFIDTLPVDDVGFE